MCVCVKLLFDALSSNIIFFFVFFRTTSPGETKLLASEIYEILQNSSNSEAEQAEAAASCRRKAQFFLGSTNKRAKTVVLQIDGLDDPVRPRFLSLWIFI